LRIFGNKLFRWEHIFDYYGKFTSLIFLKDRAKHLLFEQSRYFLKLEKWNDDSGFA